MQSCPGDSILNAHVPNIIVARCCDVTAGQTSSNIVDDSIIYNHDYTDLSRKEILLKKYQNCHIMCIRNWSNTSIFSPGSIFVL